MFWEDSLDRASVVDYCRRISAIVPIALLCASCGSSMPEMATGDAGGTDAAPDAGGDAALPRTLPTPSYGLPGFVPAQSSAVVNTEAAVLQNGALRLELSIGESISLLSLTNQLTGQTRDMSSAELFSLESEDGSQHFASALSIVEEVSSESFDGRPDAVRQSLRSGGERLVAILGNDDGLRVRWSIELRDVANYVIQTVEVTQDAANPLRLNHVVDLDTAGFSVRGRVDGSPITSRTLFAGAINPQARVLVGPTSRVVGNWTPESFSDATNQTVVRFPLGAVQPGDYTADFDYLRGGYRLEIYKVELTDGTETLRDEHFGATGTVDSENQYRFTVARAMDDAELVAYVKPDGGTDSTGQVHWLSESNQRARASVARARALGTGESWTVRSVLGVAPDGQLRRAFLYFIEQERAQPYRPFLHYNSWYDLGTFTKYNEVDAVATAQVFVRELFEERGVELQSFLFDDGWDDPTTLWSFHEGFPDGLSNAKQVLEQTGAAPGIWLSPFGGYGDPKAERLEFGQSQGFETSERGFVLSGPKYYDRFLERCLELIRDEGVNQFKFDGIGQRTEPYPGSRFDSDFAAAIELIASLREEKPDLFINLTTGTWASPFWLMHADSIWRRGHDHEFLGSGSARQRWITYRDERTYENVVAGGPLFPLSSLMIHGVIYAKSAWDLDEDPRDDLADEIWTFVGSGTHTQELYVTHTLMTEANWDELANALKWSRANTETLQDTHWIGGNPGRSQVYGWASWSPSQAIAVLRNPTSRPLVYDLDPDRDFELPPGADQSFTVQNVRKPEVTYELTAGSATEINLAPFEVVVLERNAN